MFNSNPDDPQWGGIDVLAANLMHELSHLLGAEDDGQYADDSDMYDLLYGDMPIREMDWYKRLREYCFLRDPEE